MNAPVVQSNFIPEVEQEVLGALLFGGDASETLAKLEDFHFVSRFHQVIYRAVRAAHERYNLCNPSVVLRLIAEADAEEFEKAQGTKISSYLASLCGKTVYGLARITESSRRVIEQWARISVAVEAERMLASANDPQSDVTAIVYDTAKVLDDIMSVVRSGPQRKARVSLASAIGTALDAAQDAKQNGTGLTGPSWGLADINRLTGGIQKRDLTLIGARPSMGKSTLAFSVALNVAKAGHGVGMVSLEMDNAKVAARMLSDFLYSRKAISYSDIVKGNVSDQDLELLYQTQHEVDRLPLMLDDMSGQTVTDIRVRAERMMETSLKAGSPLSVLFIDHLGLIRASSRYSGNRVNEIAEMTSGFKALARELDIAVVLLSQLNRGVESRENKRPVLSDLRDSGAIEQDADMIAFLYRESYYLERETGGSFEDQAAREDKLAGVQNKMEFIIAKQRNGALDTVHLFADMAYSAVRNGART
ncbi:DnaB-like helicase C-terminal domain-containing protein [Rhizobium sp. Root483D2]|uniref:replicative DNA helicase n=1 Tax=Rhizobium sp. Root483D2 TaxID=1736545 RepID=UPI0007140905|nr:DnaB-like helicase C-terminal domain-containing protein [Rhizobium sp. Root483D2]KQY20253.1 DNA helicase [Rhizobium sp. Root483D2]